MERVTLPWMIHILYLSHFFLTITPTPVPIPSIPPFPTMPPSRSPCVRTPWPLKPPVFPSPCVMSLYPSLQAAFTSLIYNDSPSPDPPFSLRFDPLPLPFLPSTSPSPLHDSSFSGPPLHARERQKVMKIINYLCCPKHVCVNTSVRGDAKKC